MPGFSDRAGSPDGSRKRRQRCCLPPVTTDVGTPNQTISRLNSPACTHPCQRFAAALTGANAWLGAIVGR